MQLPSNLSQLRIGRRANKKPRPIIAGQGCVGSDTKLLVCAFAVELGPHHGTRIRYPCSATSTRMIPPPRAGRGTFTTKYFLFVSRSRNLDMAKIICVL